LKGEVINLQYEQAVNFLLPKHYSGRTPSISYAFGWEIDDKLVAVCTFGKPANPYLCSGVCGEEHKSNVFELNRLCRVDELELPLSQFVAKCLRILSAYNIIVVSYSDTAMNHHGYIYQACNFIYTGVTKQRTDKYTEGNKHSRHYDNDNQKGLRKVRSPKHRYVYFCTNNKYTKSKWLHSLNYPILPYPKGDNENYILGFVLEPEIISSGCQIVQ
jgi:hypothetical protein